MCACRISLPDRRVCSTVRRFDSDGGLIVWIFLISFWMDDEQAWPTRWGRWRPSSAPWERATWCSASDPSRPSSSSHPCSTCSPPCSGTSLPPPSKSSSELGDPEVSFHHFWRRNKTERRTARKHNPTRTHIHFVLSDSHSLTHLMPHDYHERSSLY